VKENKEEAVGVQTSVSCSWCYEMNDVTEAVAAGTPIYCSNCEHRADALREKCDCRKCAETARLLRMREKQQEMRETDHQTQ
jgi:hypothetical protein